MSRRARVRAAWGTARRRARVLATRAQRGPASLMLDAIGGRPAAATSLRGVPLSPLPTGMTRELRRRRLMADLTAGIRPAGVDEVIRSLLEDADAAWDEGRLRTAAFRLEDALELVFHPARHFGADAALASDPDSVLAALRDSVLYRAISQAVRHSPRARPSRDQRTTRILFLSHGGWTFIRPVIDRYRREPDVEVRILDLAALDNPRWEPVQHDLVRAAVRRAAGRATPRLPRHLQALLAATDVVVVEWAHRQLAWLTLLAAPAGPRVVARLHSYEAFTMMPHLTDWDRVDDVVFVAAPIRALAEATVPGLTLAERYTLPNLTDLAQYARPKTDGAERTMALIGWGTMNKDPSWALDVLELVLRQDPSWRLLLVGHEPTEPLPAERAYFAQVRERIASLDDRVVITGFTSDVPEVLRGVGVILSTSRREGTHEALLQGAASGAVPVVRDWPAVAHWGGPGATLPQAWVVTTPDDAARRVLRTADDPTAGSDAQRWVLDHLDAAVVWPRLDAVIRGHTE